MDDELFVLVLSLIGFAWLLWIGPRLKVRSFQWRWIQRDRGTTRSELRALLCRDLVAARQLCGGGEDGRTRFLRACIELEAGELESARAAAAQIDIDEPVRPVLLELIERRARDSNESWLSAFESAWIETGRPDVGDSSVLPLGNDIESSVDLPRALDRLSATDRALCQLMMWRPTYWRRGQAAEAIAWAREQGPRLTDLAEVLIAANALLPESLPLAERLFELRPDELWVRLHRWAVRRPRGPLAPEDISELATIADSPTCDALVGGVALARFESAARAGGSRSPLMTAAPRALLPLVDGGAALFRRFRASTSREQDAAAATYVRLARRMLGDKLLMTCVLGVRTLELVDRIAGADLADEIARYTPEVEYAFAGPERSANDPRGWPLPSLIEDTIHAVFRDERALHARFRAPRASAADAR
jgi:hypothetical protein